MWKLLVLCGVVAALAAVTSTTLAADTISSQAALPVPLPEPGLPVRVTTTQAVFRDSHFVTTTDILAVDVPLAVKAPPASETIGQARFLKLLKRHRKGSRSSAGNAA